MSRNSKLNTFSAIVHVCMHKVNKVYLISSESNCSDKAMKPSSISERTGDLAKRPDKLWGQNNLLIYEHRKPFKRLKQARV